MRYLHSILAAAATLAALHSLPALADAKADQARAEEIVSGRCFLCHGMEGESASPVFPRLAGQHAEYLARQLGDFKSGKRKSDTMKPQSEELTPAVVSHNMSAILRLTSEAIVLNKGKLIMPRSHAGSRGLLSLLGAGAGGRAHVGCG